MNEQEDSRKAAKRVKEIFKSRFTLRAAALRDDSLVPRAVGAYKAQLNIQNETA